MRQFMEKAEIDAMFVELKNDLESRLKQQFIDFSQSVRLELDTKIEEDMFKERMKRKASLMDHSRLKEDFQSLKIYCHGELVSLL